MKEITIRLYSDTDRRVAEKAIADLGLPSSWVSFSTCDEDYFYNECFVKLTDSDFELLKFKLGLKQPDVWEF